MLIPTECSLKNHLFPTNLFSDDFHVSIDGNHGVENRPHDSLKHKLPHYLNMIT